MASQPAQSDALRELRDEMENFARYSRSVAGDTMGLRRLAWVERAEWAERLAGVAAAALDQEQH